MKSYIGSFAGVIAAFVLSSPCLAQMDNGPMNGPSRGLGGDDSVNHMRSNMSQDESNRIQDFVDRENLLKRQKARGKTLEQALAEDKAAVEALVKSMPLSCEVTAAMQVGEGQTTLNGKAVVVRTYEASCANGFGYFLVSQDPEKSDGFSCFAADYTAAADTAAGRKPGPVCQLPANADIKLMGTQVLAKAGTACTVTNYRYIGVNTAGHLEFDEFACADGKGYIVTAALPGANVPVHVETCAQSAANGLPCKFSDNGAALVTLQTFRDALAQHSVPCDATDATTRLVGRESVRKRYVVEFACKQRPKGLVAFIPLKDSTAPFETLECAAAKKRGVTCTLTQP